MEIVKFEEKLQNETKPTDIDPFDPSKTYSIANLAEALSKAQGEMDLAKKASTNPHFRSKYADIGAVIESAREALANNGLSITQTTKIVEGGMILVTRLMHKSGEWTKSEMPVPQVLRPQELGSFLTYYRRYSILGILSIGTQDMDEDGNLAQAYAERMDGVKTDPKDKALSAKEASKIVMDFKKKYDLDNNPIMTEYLKQANKGKVDLTPIILRASKNEPKFLELFDLWKKENEVQDGNPEPLENSTNNDEEKRIGTPKSMDELIESE